MIKESNKEISRGVNFANVEIRKYVDKHFASINPIQNLGMIRLENGVELFTNIVNTQIRYITKFSRIN